MFGSTSSNHLQQQQQPGRPSFSSSDYSERSSREEARGAGPSQSSFTSGGAASSRASTSQTRESGNRSHPPDGSSPYLPALPAFGSTPSSTATSPGRSHAAATDYISAHGNSHINNVPDRSAPSSSSSTLPSTNNNNSSSAPTSYYPDVAPLSASSYHETFDAQLQQSNHRYEQRSHGVLPSPSTDTIFAGERDRAGEVPLATPVSSATAPVTPGGERSANGAGLNSIAESEYSNAESLATTANNTFSELDNAPVGFDEGVLKGLCDLDCGTPLLVERIKQGMASCREASTFFKKRAVIEEEYARSMSKLTRASKESYGLSEAKAGSFVSSWLTLLRTHDYLAENRLRFASQLNDMSDELIILAKEVERSRKSSRELGVRLEKNLAEQEYLVDKARQRLDSATEDLERVLISKQGESSSRDPYSIQASTSPSSASFSNTAGKMTANRSFGKAISKLKGPKTLAQVAKQEEECRSRLGQSSDAYRGQVVGAQSARHEYFNTLLPKVLRGLKESADECDLGTQYHLSRYAYLFESTLVNDGMTISPVSADDGPGLKTIVESIDNREDFKTFMTQFALSWQMSGQRGPRREAPMSESYPAASTRANVSPRIASTPPAPVSHPTFGVDLGEQMARDNVEVPRVLVKCCEVIEAHGLDSMGIYRLSGTTSRVQRLKGHLDRDVEGVDLFSEDNLSDINNTSAVLKLWFRELPEPLLTWELYHGFVEAAKIENDRLRHIRLHERVNDLPDPNYATLKFLMGHLDKVRKLEPFNQMGCSNLAIVFGPNLLGAPPNTAQSMSNGAGGGGLADIASQCKCVETILQHYEEIFVDGDAN